MERCPECGAEVNPRDIHCYNCGRTLDEPSETTGQSGWGQQGSATGDTPPGERRRGRQYDQGDGQYGGQGQGQYGDQGQYGGQGRGQYGGRGQGQYGTRAGNTIENGKVSYALKYPITGGWRPLIFGSLCGLFFFLVIPIIFFAGYMYNLTKSAARGDTLKPSFDNIGDLIVPGLIFFVIALIFAVVNNGISFALGVGPTTTATGDPATDINTGASVISFIVSAVIGYFAPAVYTTYAATDNAAKALSLVPTFTFTKRYFVSYLIYLGLGIAAGVIAIPLIILSIFLGFTIIGLVLVIPFWPAFLTYFYYVTAAFWGATYYQAARDGIVPPVSEAGRSTGRTDSAQQQRY